MASDSECEQEQTYPIVKVENTTTSNRIPETSRKQYESVYKVFMDWREDQKMTSFSENVLTAFFGYISKKYKPATLWTQFSMLRTMLTISHNVNIAQYAKLRAFLKQNASSYIAKKPKTFTAQEINKFIAEAPDQQYLLIKTALIIGAMGACLRNELNQMKTTHLSDLGTAVLVKVPDTRRKRVRTFTITNHFYDIIKKYWNLRPPNTVDPSFFLNYHKGKCTTHKIGVNQFGAMGKLIATYLKLPNPELYSGRFFRRALTTVLVNPGEAGCESLLAGSYMDSSLNNECNKGDKNQSTMESTAKVPAASEDNNTCQNHEFFLEHMPSKMIFNNCNISFNIIKNKEFC